MTYYDEWEQNLAIKLGLIPRKEDECGDQDGDHVEEHDDH